MSESLDLAVEPVSRRAGLVAKASCEWRPVSLSTSLRTASGRLAMVPKNRTSPRRPPSASATAIVSLLVSKAT